MQRLKQVEDSFKAKKVTDVKSGDTVRVHQRIKEGNKERTQIFEGLVVNTRRPHSATHTITVRRVASGVGVEKTFQMHSPLIEKIEVIKRSQVRRKKLSYMRTRSGKSARLAAVEFDSDKVNYVPDVEDKTEAKESIVEEAQAKEIEEPKTEEADPSEKEKKASSGSNKPADEKDKAKAEPAAPAKDAKKTKIQDEAKK